MINPGSVKKAAPSVHQFISIFIPSNPMNPLLNPVNQRLTWAQALRMPGDNVFKRMHWSALVFDALRAEALDYRIAAHHILAQQLEHARESHRSSDASSSNGSSQYKDTPMAGELDADYNSPDAMDELKKTEETKHMAVLAGHVANLYKTSTADIQAALGITEQDDMTDAQLNEWMENNQGDEFDAVKGYLLNNMVEHSAHFGLEQMDVAEHFLNRVTAMLMNAKKSVSDLEKLEPTLFAKAFDNHFDALSKLTNAMVSEATRLIHKAGSALSLEPPHPEPSFQDQMNTELEQMGAPGLSASAEMDPAHRIDQLRLAAIKLVYPDAPKPQNALKQAIQPDPEHASHESIKGELAHYAKVLGVALKSLGKAADQTLLQKIWPAGSPNHQATHDLLQKHPTESNEPVRKSLAKREMEKAMKPKQEG